MGRLHYSVLTSLESWSLHAVVSPAGRVAAAGSFSPSVDEMVKNLRWVNEIHSLVCPRQTSAQRLLLQVTSHPVITFIPRPRVPHVVLLEFGVLESARHTHRDILVKLNLYRYQDYSYRPCCCIDILVYICTSVTKTSVEGCAWAEWSYFETVPSYKEVVFTSSTTSPTSLLRCLSLFPPTHFLLSAEIYPGTYRRAHHTAGPS